MGCAGKGPGSEIGDLPMLFLGVWAGLVGVAVPMLVWWEAGR